MHKSAPIIIKIDKVFSCSNSTLSDWRARKKNCCGEQKTGNEKRQIKGNK
jgi:hypothetical protein